MSQVTLHLSIWSWIMNIHNETIFHMFLMTFTTLHKVIVYGISACLTQYLSRKSIETEKMNREKNLSISYDEVVFFLWITWSDEYISALLHWILHISINDDNAPDIKFMIMHLNIYSTTIKQNWWVSADLKLFLQFSNWLQQTSSSSEESKL